MPQSRRTYGIEAHTRLFPVIDFIVCPFESNWTSGEWGLHSNRALAYLILYGSMPGRLLIPIMKIKDHLQDQIHGAVDVRGFGL
jgi:hypothetical protein